MLEPWQAMGEALPVPDHAKEETIWLIVVGLLAAAARQGAATFVRVLLDAVIRRLERDTPRAERLASALPPAELQQDRKQSESSSNSPPSAP